MPSALYLRQVALAARDLEPVVEDICAVFETEVRHVDPDIGEFGLCNAVISVGSQFVEVVSPLTESASASRFIARRGEGLYALLLQCDDAGEYRARTDELGIRRLMELESGDFRCFQMHPSDARSSVLLEIDQQPGAPRGPYYPGGNIVFEPGAARIGAVHIPVADPAQLAARWGQLLGRPLTSDTPGVDLDNAALRFVGDPTTRAVVEVTVSDGQRAREIAAGRGLLTADDTVTVGGLDFRITTGG
jgi:hypothetical protein